jgi:hypothetical protein
MSSISIKEEIVEALESLSPELQHQVLGFVRGLGSHYPKGKPGSALLEFCGAIDADDLALMEAAINEDCSKIDYEEW